LPSKREMIFVVDRSLESLRHVHGAEHLKLVIFEVVSLGFMVFIAHVNVVLLIGQDLSCLQQTGR
jgi:hypothetical protein